MTFSPSSPNPETQPEAPGPQPRMVQLKVNLTKPKITYIILGVTVFVYLMQTASQVGILRDQFITLGNLLMGSELMNLLIQQSGSYDIPLLIGSKISPLIVDGQIWRLITPVLLHASLFDNGFKLFSLFHIGFNMYALFIIGPSLEAYFGRWRFLVLYLLGGLGGNILSFWMTPGLSIGASTAIFGLFAAQGVFIFQNRALIGQKSRQMLNNVVFLLVINLMIGMSNGIDNWGHLGGLIAGATFAWFSCPKLFIDQSGPEPELIDKSSQISAVLAAIVVAFALAALTLLRIRMG